MREYVEEPNRAKRLAIWKKAAQKYFIDDVPYYVIGWAKDRYFVWRDKVKNWERGPGQEYSHAKAACGALRWNRNLKVERRRSYVAGRITAPAVCLFLAGLMMVRSSWLAYGGSPMVWSLSSV